MENIDNPSKARSFLITFSTLVFVLFYFGADLSDFKLMGNEIKLTENTKNTWLILALTNTYLWIRYFQRLPPKAFQFNNEMNEVFDSALISLSILTLNTKRKIKNIFTEKKEIKTKTSIEGRMPYHKFISNAEENCEFINPGDLSRQNRLKILIITSHLVAELEKPSFTHWKTVENTPYTPNILISGTARAYAITKGAITTPWLTDTIAPLIFGGICISLSIYKWIENLNS